MQPLPVDCFVLVLRLSVSLQETGLARPADSVAVPFVGGFCKAEFGRVDQCCWTS